VNYEVILLQKSKISLLQNIKGHYNILL